MDREGRGGGWRRVVSRLHGGRRRRRGRAGQSCSALHTPESTGSWIRLSWACKSSRLDTSYSGSDRCSRTGEGGAHRKRGTEVRGGTTTVDKSRRRQLKEISACCNILFFFFHFNMQQSKSKQPSRIAVHSRSDAHVLFQQLCISRKAWKVRTAKSRGEEHSHVLPSGLVRSRFVWKIVGTESSGGRDLDIYI